MQGGNKAAAGGDQIGSKKGADADSDSSIPVKAVAEGVATPNTATDIDSSGLSTVPCSAQWADSACRCTHSDLGSTQHSRHCADDVKLLVQPREACR